eukprot:NODE_941_length_1215_cov_85.220412_g708_i0.p1 GENE.NODE_941_length_1215_cov_85.220412_g708_i0~~NODE_941_length_1215_cov_85.220412_g708_i0.p1  ORF type:complete len:302 (+),score=71.00 NODE_941_length_1215_cov_85.220412_g708_i0:33-938(+)
MGDQVCKEGALLCSNTSALDIDAIASVTRRPGVVMGTHFFSPANVMLLLENVRGAQTTDTTISTCMEWGKKIGKWPILVGNCPGFVGNRMLAQYTTKAMELLDFGIFPHQVDTAIAKFGMKMGPFAMQDLVGLDLGIQALKKKNEWKPQTNIKHAIIESGRLGQKNGKGYYEYDENRKPSPSAAVNDLISRMAAGPKRPFTEAEIIHWAFFPLVNEGFKVLEEGIAQRPGDIDVCYVHGYGYPRVKGGPMHWADTVGLALVRDGLKKMGIAPSALLETCVANKSTLAKYWPKHVKAKLSKL